MYLFRERAMYVRNSYGAVAVEKICSVSWGV